MAEKPVENLIYEFLAENLAEFTGEIPEGEQADFEIHPSAYERWNKDNGIVVGDADTSMLPNGNDIDMTEFDGLLALEIYSRVAGQDKTNRLPARQKVFDIKKKLLQLLEEFPTLNNRGCLVRAERQVRFFDDTRADKYAIERVPIVINPRGSRGE